MITVRRTESGWISEDTAGAEKNRKIVAAAEALVRALEDLQRAVGPKPGTSIRSGLPEPTEEPS